MNPNLISVLTRLGSETPETGADMLAGYIVITVVLLGYILSLVLRWRRAQAELALHESTEEEG